MRIEYTTREGRVIKATYNREAAYRRLAALEAAERHIQEVAPTDSGSVRFSNTAEADALRKAIFNKC